MDDRSEVRDFLASRRARLTPEQAGLLGNSARFVFLDSRSREFYPATAGARVNVIVRE